MPCLVHLLSRRLNYLRDSASLKSQGRLIQRMATLQLKLFNRTAMGQVRFMFYTLFTFFLIFVLSVTRPKLPLSQILNHATCDVFSPKAVETLIHGQCHRYCFLYCVQNTFSFGFIKVLDSKGITNMLKKVLRQSWNALKLQLSLSIGDK